jgi:hypothetical protein
MSAERLLDKARDVFLLLFTKRSLLFCDVLGFLSMPKLGSASIIHFWDS